MNPYLEQLIQFAENLPEKYFPIIVAAIFLVPLYILSRPRRPKRRKKTSWNPNYRRKPTIYNNPSSFAEKRSIADPLEQVSAISKVGFEKRHIMNKGEFQLFLEIERTVRALNDGHRVMAQTSLGELIQPRRSDATDEARKRAYASVNSKRVDFAIVDRWGLLAVAVEFHGAGHFHSTSFIRDAVKREALRRAGVEMIEISDNWKSSDVEARIRAALLPPQTVGADQEPAPQ
ncbi:DUF2726 domain-containing protein [Rhodobacteraceae bacterium NNCM2]|nr:DUF2726 domain-containing protein [Coraliihabitans acroporae]